MANVKKVEKKDSGQEVKLADLPIGEANADEVKGGAIVIDNGSGMCK